MTWVTLSYLLQCIIFLIIILKLGTVFSRLVSLVIVKVVWCKNNCSDGCLWGQTIAVAS